MTTKLSSGRARFRRSTAALGIAGLTLAGLAGPALAAPEDSPADTTSPPTVDPEAEDEHGDSVNETEGDNGSTEEGSEEDVAQSTPAQDTTDAEDEISENDEESLETTAVRPLQANAETVQVDLVGLNDFHGRIDAGLSKDEDGNVTTEAAAVRLAAAVEDARANNPNTFFVGAGDLYSASTFTSMAGDDVPTTDVFNAIGMDTSAVGNHEFDHGFQNLQDRIAGNGDYAGHAISWEYLGANVYEEGTTDAVLPEYFMLETDDVDIAAIGLVTQETPSLVTPAGIAGLDFGDPAEAVQRVIDENQEVQDADTIIVLTHDGGVNGEAVSNTNTHFGKFARAMADRGDIAGIFSGHTHTKYEVPLDVPTSVSTVGTMPVIQTGSFGENLGLISLTFDVDDDGNATLSGATSDMTALSDVTPPPGDANAIVAQVRNIVDEAVERAEELGNVEIGEAGADLNRAQHTDPETGNVVENRGGESTISNLIADAQLWAVHEQGATDNLPVIAFMNPGGVRTDIPEGKVTYKQVADVQPFANTLETLDLTGAQIKQILEEQWQPDGSSRPFLKLGINEEFFYTYDPEAPRDERVTHMFLDEEPIDLDATYRVVTNNFLASGGDNFFTLGEGANYADTGLVDLQAFVDYFEARDVVYPDYRQRAVGVHWVSGEDGAHAAGEDVEIHLSSLVFSTNEPKSETIFASLTNSESGETLELGEFEVDPAIVNTNDEMGRAIVEFAMPDIEAPEDDSESWILEISDDLGLVSLAWDITVEQDSEKTPPPTDEGEDDGGDGGGAAPGDDMPDTGADVNGMLIATAILLAVGGTALAVRRRQTMS